MAAAARVVPAVSRSLPIFTGGKKEDLQEFINLIDHVHQRERVLYDDDAVPGARRALLVEVSRVCPDIEKSKFKERVRIGGAGFQGLRSSSRSFRN
jgi:hypothetical protein